MPFTLRLALRYLRPRASVVSAITILSVAGVSLGVAVLLIVIAVMKGFEAQIKETALGYEPHIDLFDERSRPAPWQDFSDVDEASVRWEEIRLRALALPYITNAAPYVQGIAILAAEDGKAVSAAAILGIEDDRDDPRVNSLRDLVNTAADGEGNFDLDGEGIILELSTLRSLGAQVGDLVTIYAPTNMGDLVSVLKEIEEARADGRDLSEIESIDEVVYPREMEIVATFRGLESGGVGLGIVPLWVGQEFFGLGGEVSGLALHTTDPYRAGEFKQSLILEGLASEPWWPITWMERHQRLFAAVRSERAMMYVVLFFIVGVAAFCVMNTMIMVSVQKRREIGVLAALGARAEQIMWVFLAQGMVVGAFGTLFGLFLGTAFLALRNQLRDFLGQQFGVEIFDEATYGISQIPAKFDVPDVAIISAGAFLLCSLASLVPAAMAARVDPARALRNE